MNIVAKNVVAVLVVLTATCVALPQRACGEDSAFAPQRQDELQPMLSIDWKKGPDLPQGFQDSVAGIVDGTLVTAGGFCQGIFPGAANWAYADELNAKKPGRYPRGFLKKAWGLTLQTPPENWSTLPDLPGIARQGLSGAVVDGKFYCWGGFNYTAPFCYKDGYCLSQTDGRWDWTALPDLPWPLANHGICAVGGKIYLMGGAEYQADKDFFSAANHAGNIARMGARLFVLDTRDLAAGWKELCACPGTPRFAHAVAAVGKYVYVIGGATGVDNPSGKYCTVVDNWRYEPATDGWQRLRDLPVASGNFPPGQIVAFQRYILLVGGAQYGHVLGPDGVLAQPYGKPTRHYPNNPYCSDVFVYDTHTNLFGTATALPLNNNGATTVVEGNHIHLMGGETGGCEIEGEKFGHHPDLYLVGTLREISH